MKKHLLLINIGRTLCTSQGTNLGGISTLIGLSSIVPTPLVQFGLTIGLLIFGTTFLERPLSKWTHTLQNLGATSYDLIVIKLTVLGILTGCAAGVSLAAQLLIMVG